MRILEKLFGAQEKTENVVSGSEDQRKEAATDPTAARMQEALENYGEINHYKEENDPMNNKK
ncbi:MAG: hypothetical protein MUD00_01360 [Candidatus Pacebacteria bacterium]|jgi:hypothetical protein|nr:hypothetical protein [Candidatus Paceibacterota bacterium]